MRRLRLTAAVCGWLLVSAVACSDRFTGKASESTGGTAGDAGEAGESSSGTSNRGGTSGTSSGGSSGSATGGSSGSATGGANGGSTSGASGLGGSSGAAAGIGGALGGAGAGGSIGGGSGGTAGAGGARCGQDLLENGSFDDGTMGWSEEVSDDTPLIFHRANTLLIDEGVDTHSPDYLAWLGGDEDRVARLWQSVEVPDYAQLVRVTGFYWITTGESDPVVYDQALVELVQGNTSLALAHFTNEDEVSGWTAFEGSLEVSALEGSAITFQLRSEVDGSAATNFFFDSIVFTFELVDCPR